MSNYVSPGISTSVEMYRDWTTEEIYDKIYKMEEERDDIIIRNKSWKYGLPVYIAILVEMISSRIKGLMIIVEERIGASSF